MHRTRLVLAATLAGFVTPALPAPVFATEAQREPSAPLKSPTGPALGAPAPAFALKTLDGRTVSLESYRGKTLVVNVWATWCPPCRQEMPDLIRAVPKLEKQNVAVLGVDTTESPPVVRVYAVAKEIPYPLAVASDASFARAYDVEELPTTYVIDPQGVLRARYVDVLGSAQLTALVAAAQAGRNAQIVSPLQGKIDATLADSTIVFTDKTTIEANAKRAEAAIATAERLAAASDAAGGNPVDLFRTRAEEATLRDRAIAALVDVGTSVDDKTLLTRLRGDAARDREQWSDAADAYRGVLELDPNDRDALAGLALAERRLGNAAAVVDADAKLAMLAPDDAAAVVDLARAQATADRRDDASATFGRAIALAKQQADRSRRASDVRTLAYAHLYAGRFYGANGDDARARAEFGDALAWAAKLPPGDPRHDMYLEEGQEALVALGLQRGSGVTVALAPWTGPELPGSIPNTMKYRLVLAGNARSTITLRASDVPAAWVASFCSDRVCAPNRTTVALPEAGIKIVEFQLVPPAGMPPTPKVRITAADGRTEASAST